MIIYLTAWLRTLDAKPHDERGWSASVEKLLWIIGTIAMVGVAMAALNGYITGQLAKIH